GAGAGSLSFLLIDLSNVGLVALVCGWYLGRRGHPLGSRERQLVGLIVFMTLGFVALVWAPLPWAHSEAAEQRLKAYPSIMVMAALLCLLQGRLWVGFYLIGGLFLAGAFAVGAWPQAGPLAFAALFGAMSFGLGLFLRLQARRADRGPRRDADVS